MKRFSTYIVIFILAGCSVDNDPAKLDAYFRHQLINWNEKLTKVVIGDVLTPPVCSRVYAYTNIAAYEALRADSDKYGSYAGRLNQLADVPRLQPGESYYLPLSSVIAFSTVAQKVVFNSDAVVEYENDLLADLDKLPIDDDVKQRSVEYGRLVGRHIIEWASKDGYLQRNALPGYTVNREIWRWQPTPPDYTDAVEPNWHTLRPFVLDSASQFRPPKPEVFDSVVHSGYYKSALQVYNSVMRSDKEEVAIAKFWDCNPNISVTQGHVMFFQQKISPGGHWLNVAATVCKKENIDDLKTAQVLSSLAITIADSFINCWEAKFHYNTIRPETVINRYIDKEWRPLLQTPPFPEYPSGHSVVSGASASVLTHYFGDNYSYVDSTEVPFGLPPRTFRSFNDAAYEASMSRLYGGIHFLASLNRGLEEGRQLSTFIIQQLNKPNQTNE